MKRLLIAFWLVATCATAQVQYHLWKLAGGAPPAEPLPASCIGYWTTNSGTTWYEQVSGNNGTFNGGYTWSNDYAHFDGSSGKCDIPYAAYTNLGNNWTISMWVRSFPVGDANWFAGCFNPTIGFCVGSDYNGGSGRGTNNCVFIFGNSAPANKIWGSTNNSLSHSTWHHVAFVVTNYTLSSAGFYCVVDGATTNRFTHLEAEWQPPYTYYGDTSGARVGGIKGYSVFSKCDVAYVTYCLTNLTASEIWTEKNRAKPSEAP